MSTRASRPFVPLLLHEVSQASLLIMPPMEDFSRDCLRLGCLRAFVHFSLTLRGREELVVIIRTQVCQWRLAALLMLYQKP